MERRLVGKRLDISGENWKESEATLVFAMSTSCHFCSASAPFYQKLTGDVLPSMRGKVKTLAVLPESREAAEVYTKNTLGVQFDAIQQARADVPGTPTLLLVDRNGVVKDAWLGLLDRDRQPRMVAELNADMVRLN
jgi:hypothetical protein